jgi:hypothetical protein
VRYFSAFTSSTFFVPKCFFGIANIPFCCFALAIHQRAVHLCRWFESKVLKTEEVQSRDCIHDMANAGGWLRGKTVRKGGIASNAHTRSSTPQVQSTSSTIFGGGVKDPSGRTSEYFVSAIETHPSYPTDDVYEYRPWTINVRYAKVIGI